MVSSVNAIWKRSRQGWMMGYIERGDLAFFLPTQGYNMLICLPLSPTCSLLGFVTHSCCCCSSVTSRSNLIMKTETETTRFVYARTFRESALKPRIYDLRMLRSAVFKHVSSSSCFCLNPKLPDQMYRCTRSSPRSPSPGCPAHPAHTCSH